MNRNFFKILVIFFLFLIFDSYSEENIVNVKINQEIQYQTILGWGSPCGIFWISDDIIDEIIEVLVNDLGLNRIRFEIPRREWEDVFNDDEDPYHINWNSFKKDRTDSFVKKIIIPFKKRVEEKNEHFSLYISPSFFNNGSSGSIPPYLFYSPYEYTEWVIAILIYLRDKYGIIPDHYSICNEAGNNNPFTPHITVKIAKVLSEKLKELGFKTKIQFPECVNVNTSLNWIKSVESDNEFWNLVGLISYHLYGNNSGKEKIKDFAFKLGIPTGQTEFMGLTVNHLYEDIIFGGVSYWEFYAIKDILPLNKSRTWFSHTKNFWEIRQIIYYVRPGAKRIESISDNEKLKTLAFLKDRRITLILLNNQPDSQQLKVRIKGLSEGIYGVSYTEKGNYYEGKRFKIENTSEIIMDISPNTIMTIYPSQKNMPPVIINWKSEPSFIKLPNNQVKLFVKAIDPEGETLKYQWQILEQPKDVSMKILNPESSETIVIGLNQKGKYVFSISVSDNFNKILKKVIVKVLEGNQPPEIFDLHNRIPVTVTLPEQKTELRASGFDIEGDNLEYKWIVIEQPEGANAILETPDKPSCVVSNLSLPGDYVFRIQLSDKINTVWKNLKVTVYPFNSPPIIEEITSIPSILKLPQTDVILKAKIKDNENDIVTCFWSLKSCPSEAKVYFEKPGLSTTKVYGLSIPGKYIFTLTAIDRTKFITRDITIMVEK
ncbi:MAG: hypothetical protein NC827_06355 [Candidatus Omnitrophica bacterium]|nr:hypothetical protein [Candidatus Omnitrophota bacterium]MCM8802911.1 hypothetical protein [Candidatus Omnitrophota bacterium]